MSPVQSDSFCIYVHAPWCRYRCPYCSFNVYISSNPEIENWKENLTRDWNKQQVMFPGKAHSLYFGGGTPSRIEVDTLRDVVHSLPLENNAEIGIEINPDDATLPYLKALTDSGLTGSPWVFNFSIRCSEISWKGTLLSNSIKYRAFIKPDPSGRSI